MPKIVNVRNKRFLIFLASSICILILLGGYFYFRYEENIIRNEKYENLKTIAELKINQITLWRKERLGDANAVYRNSFFVKGVEQFLYNGHNSDLKNDFLEQLSVTKTNSGYENIFITSPKGELVFSVDPTLKRVDSITRRFIIESAIPQKVIFTDLYYCPPDRKIYYDIIIPVINRKDISIATLIFRVDPNEYLYPLFQSWPTPSKSSEILIVRKNGDSVIYLNELRHRSHTALALQISLTKSTIPAVRAVLGYEGICEGKDYRGVDVLAYVCKIPGTPWFMVAKVDRSEIFTELSYRTVVIVIFTLVFIILTGVAIAWIYHLRLINIYKKLFNSDIRYRRLFETAKEGIIFLDADNGMIIDVNPFIIEMLGFSHDQFLGKHLWDLGFFRNVIENKDKFFELQEKEYIHYEDMPFETFDGRRIDVEFINNIYKVGSQKVVQCNIRNITERKHSEQKLKQTNIELERSNKELEQFAYIASHDLQEPLRMISSFTQLLAKKYNHELGKEADEFIHYIVDGANRMQHLIQDLLSFSRIINRGDSFSPADSRLAMEEAIANLHVSIKESGAIITYDDLPVIMADYGQMVQVFQNLIGNAVKFHSEESPRIHISATPEDGEWLFSVKDNGIGIEAQYFTRIFIIFQRLHTGAQYPGTGIGLAICNRIIHRHEGRIWVESEPGKGSVFYFTIKM